MEILPCAEDQRLELVLVHPVGLPIDGTDPVDLSLGGSETAVVSMARALRRLGHRVSVYTVTGEPHECCGVDYRPADRLVRDRSGRECDVLLNVRMPQPQLSVEARMYGFWFHDLPSPELLAPLRVSLARSSFCFLLSRFHLESFEEHLPGLGQSAVLTTNGVDFDQLGVIREEGRKSAAPRFLYASRPERGLLFLLREIWPVLKRRIPEAELLVTTYAYSGGLIPSVREYYGLCDELVRRSPGVHQIGPLTRRQFWRELASATAVLYPADFSETSCMVALEAQAMGTPIVTTGRSALAETVGCRETLITAPPGSPEYVREFVDLTMRLVEDPGFAEHARQAGHRHVTRETHSWDAIARTWHDTFHRLFHERFEKRKAGVLRRLLRESRVETARRLVSQEAAPEASFHPADLAELEERRRAKPAELDEEPVWVEPGPGAVPAQMSETWQALLDILGEGEAGASLLDVGCFCANITMLFAKDRPWLRLTGVDGNPKAIDAADRKARELGMGSRTRFLCLADPHRSAVSMEVPELAAASHDAAVLCEVLEYFPDPLELLEWAESRARKGVVGYTLHGPWEALTGERFRLHHLGEPELRRMLGGKEGLELRYVRCRTTSRGEPLGLWVFRYRVAPGNAPGRLDLDHGLRRTPPLPRIAATLLIKNEEAHIRRCVESLEPVADEIVIGDTGCTDLTVDILRSMGFGSSPARRIAAVPFEDFAQARNHLARQADGDYILWQDADEILVHGHVLRQLADRNEHFDAFALEQRHAMLDMHHPSDFPLRCFRPETAEGPLRWYGCIHEQVEHRLDEGPGKVLVCPEVYVGHLGYLHEQIRANKLYNRNLALFLKDRQENPGRRMGYVLGIREYLNLAMAEIHRAQQMTGKAWRYLNYGFEVWHHHVRHMPAGFRDLGYPVSRDVLEVLARHGRPLRLTGKVPFQADLAIEIAAGDQPAGNGERPRNWTYFSDLDEMRIEWERLLNEAKAGRRERTEILALPIDLDSAPEMRAWSLPPELFGLEAFR